MGDVMVVGGGISGIQAALDLSSAGYKVYLVEKSPTVGGKMSQLDKTFPTNDCSMCIESPKFIETDRQPNIQLLTYTDVDSVEGKPGDFTVTLLKKPRYVNEDKCTGCTVCVEYCPVKVPDQFNQNLSQNKAVHIYFSQAVPLVTYIDESCLFLKDKTCNICETVCENDAIDFGQKAEKVKVKVGAIILSPGYETFDPLPRNDYGYGQYANVVTSMDFERLLCSTGPHEGQILRPSDKKHPQKIAWIHCVGSRQVTPGGNSYCSAVCCSYTQKQVILAKDHLPDLHAKIFHNDIRSYGKDFERFYQRAHDLPDVHFVRSYVSIGSEDPETGNVSIRYATPDGVVEEFFELVVLSVGLVPPRDAPRFSKVFGIELNHHGFCKTSATASPPTPKPATSAVTLTPTLSSHTTLARAPTRTFAVLVTGPSSIKPLSLPRAVKYCAYRSRNKLIVAKRNQTDASVVRVPPSAIRLAVTPSPRVLRTLAPTVTNNSAGMGLVR